MKCPETSMPTTSTNNNNAISIISHPDKLKKAVEDGIISVGKRVNGDPTKIRKTMTSRADRNSNLPLMGVKLDRSELQLELKRINEPI